jgi:hypothetical protein
MKQRDIIVEQVVETLESPDDYLIGDEGEEIAIKQYSNYELKVVYREIADEVLVYTVIKARITLER